MDWETVNGLWCGVCGAETAPECVCDTGETAPDLDAVPDCPKCGRDLCGPAVLPGFAWSCWSCGFNWGRV